MKRLAAILALTSLSACATGSQPSTGLFEQGTHSGTLTVLRVEDNWVPDRPVFYKSPENKDAKQELIGWQAAREGRCNLRLPNGQVDDENSDASETEAPSAVSPLGFVSSETPSDCHNPLRRFVPLRHKDELGNFGLSEEDIVDDTEDVTLTLNYAFIRYFKEGVNSPADFFRRRRASPQGEIALVLSFDSGDVIQQSFLVYASQGQTFGSYLDFQDWVVAGPVKVTAANLSIRMVMIEMDQAENERTKNFIRGLAQVAPVVSPGISQAVPIATPIAETLVSQNIDDVVFDQRFTLKRMLPGEDVRRGALLYGKYIALSQEDALANNNARDRAAPSILPIDVQDLRYDLHSDRLYKVYPYLPAAGRARPPARAQSSSSDSRNVETVGGKGGPTLPAPARRSRTNSWVPKYISEPQELKFDATECRIGGALTLLNDDLSAARRTHLLGFGADGKLDALDTHCSKRNALGKIAWESARLTTRGEQGEISQLERLDPSLFNDEGEYIFPYPVLDFRRAYTLASQYAQHTHIVFTIEESVGHSGQAYHERFPKYSEFLEQAIQQAQDDTQVETLAENLSTAIISQKKSDAAIAWLRANRDATQIDKSCRLFNTLEKSDSTAVSSNAYLLNKLSGQEGTYFSSVEDAYLHLASTYKGEFADGFEGLEDADSAIGKCAAKPTEE